MFDIIIALDLSMGFDVGICFVLCIILSVLKNVDSHEKKIGFED